MREPGIYFDISNADYHAGTFAVGNSGLQLVADCPALYHGQYLDPEKPEQEERDSAAQQFGNMAHCVLFEHHAFNQRYRVGPEVKSKALKAWKEFAETLPADCEGIKPSQYKAAQRIRQSALALADLREALEHPGGRGEASVYWRDERTGVLCKIRPDWFMPVGDRSVVLFDAKTFATGDAGEFSRQAARMGYDFQAAFYTDGFMRATGLNVLAFIHIVISNQWPHPVNTVQLGERSINTGRLKYRRALDTYAECKRTGIWPGYAPGIKLVEMPTYALEDIQ